MKILGISGGIGTGKTTVCRVLELLGMPVYYADTAAQRLIANDPEIKAEIQAYLGTDAYKDGIYQKKWVAERVFKDGTLLQKLNEIVHPRVRKDWENWLENHQKFAWVAREAALLTQPKIHDCLWVIDAPLHVRMVRIKKRDPQRSEEEIINIIQKQNTSNNYLEEADYVINNDESDLIIPQIVSHWDMLK